MSGRGKSKGGEKKKAVSRSTKAGLQFPVGRIARYLRKGRVWFLAPVVLLVTAGCGIRAASTRAMQYASVCRMCALV